MRLPPGMSSSDFAAAVAEFERAVGKQWVFTRDEDVDLYRDAFSPFLHEAEELVASAAVAPAATLEVQEIVRIANRRNKPAR
jgi:FAD/FMN-containing dehydrogenase